MAKMMIKGPEDYMSRLSKLGSDSVKICEKAVKAGANPVANEIRSGLENLQESKFRKLSEDEKFVDIPSGQKKDLLNALGITPVGKDHSGVINVKIGFDGYGSYPTKKYKNGVPNALLARAIESGSSTRQKTPFLRKAVNKSKQKAIEEMNTSIESDMKIYAL